MPPSVEKHHLHEQQQQQKQQEQQQHALDNRKTNGQNNDELSEQEVMYINTFGDYCRAFYTASLQCRSSSSSSTSLSSSLCSCSESDEDEEKGAKEKTKEDGQVVLNAFDYASNCCHDVPSSSSLTTPTPSKLYQTYLSNLSSTQLFHLQQCGLSSPTLPSLLLQKANLKSRYIQKRDEERRRAHKISMFQRHSTLSNIVMTAEEEEYSTRSVLPLSEGKNENHEDDNNIPRLAQREEINKLHNLVTSFVSKYSKNIGTHSFFAGLIRCIETQMKQTSDQKIVRWTFRQVVLSEATVSGDGDEYVKDAVSLLLSFMVRIKNEEDHVEAPFLSAEDLEEEEGNIPDVGEKTTSWEMDPTISNYQLSRLISLFPGKKDLHARPTGTLEVIVVDEEERKRRNVDGKLDEVDSIFTSWCTMLSIL